jgi:hypothetical protein
MPNLVEQMKLLFSSADLGEVGQLVKRLVWARIPCAVCRDAVNAYLSVWIQQDVDYPLALRIFTHRDRPRPLPRWACVFDTDLPANKGSASHAANGSVSGSSSANCPVSRTGFVWANPGPQKYNNENRILRPTTKPEAAAPLAWLMLPSLPHGRSTRAPERLPEATPPRAGRADTSHIPAEEPVAPDAGIPGVLLPK